MGDQSEKAKGDPQSELKETPFEDLLGSLRAKIYADPTGGDSRFEVQTTGARPAMLDPLSTHSTIAIFEELNDRLSTVNEIQADFAIDKIEEALTDQMVGPAYTVPLARLAFHLGEFRQLARNARRG